MDNDKIKKNISQRRIHEGISQDEMARRLGIVRNTYRNIEKGNSLIVSKHLNDIATVLGTTPEELVLGYTPLKDSGTVKEAKVQYENKLAELKETYEARIADLIEKIEDRDKTIADLREIIQSKTEIIALLKRQLTDAKDNC